MSTESSTASIQQPAKTSIWAYPLILLIQIYRATLSPIYGGACRFVPTCSEYAEQALRKYGAYRGSIMAIKRVLRCHPWHAPGYDPVE
ncbi:MAG TPA: membrane protein insertion efficiency factor YidD [candidate division Zixibacteria bacterium]|nr:membrane protein insertion efficiency factor YidD [candidate division Zixibacteria bacterium]